MLFYIFSEHKKIEYPDYLQEVKLILMPKFISTYIVIYTKLLINLTYAHWCKITKNK